MDNNTQLILTELERLRYSLIEHRADATDRLTRIETRLEPLSTIPDRMVDMEAKTRPLFDNGQPGRLSRIEGALGSVQKFKYTLIGYAAAAGTMCGGLVSIVALIVNWMSHKR